MSFLIGYVEVPSFVLGITTRSKSINKSSHLYTAPPKRSPLAWIKREPYKIRDKSLSCQRDWEAHEPKAPSPEVEPQTNILFTALYVGGSRDSSNLTQAVVTEDCPLPPIVFSLMATKPPVSKKVKKKYPRIPGMHSSNTTSHRDRFVSYLSTTFTPQFYCPPSLP